MEIRPVKRVSVGDQVYDQLREQLLRGQWKPGDRLPSENELAEGFGVSRITVRQALQRLAALGLLETRFGEGTFVRAYSPGMAMTGMIPAAYLGGSSLLEVLEFRGIIESTTAELAAKKATDEDKTSLAAIFGRMVEVRHDKKAFFRADFDFHLALAGITGNTLVIETYSILREVLEVAMEEIVGLRGDTGGVHYHRLLLDAVRANDSARCREIMEEHIRDTYDSIAKLLSSNRVPPPLAGEHKEINEGGTHPCKTGKP